MRSFFHGWRRKAGVVSLLMACGLMVSWLRSYISEERFWIRMHDRCHVITHSHGRLEQISFDLAKDDGENIRSLGWFSQKHTGNLFPQWHFEPDYHVVAHWLVVLPLTLLSAYLILWKPRKAKSSRQPANSNPISN